MRRVDRESLEEPEGKVWRCLRSEHPFFSPVDSLRSGRRARDTTKTETHSCGEPTTTVDCATTTTTTNPDDRTNGPWICGDTTPVVPRRTRKNTTRGTVVHHRRRYRRNPLGVPDARTMRSGRNGNQSGRRTGRTVKRVRLISSRSSKGGSMDVRWCGPRFWCHDRTNTTSRVAGSTNRQIEPTTTPGVTDDPLWSRRG